MNFESGSFRDRRGRVWVTESGVFRVLNARAHEDWLRLEKSQLYQNHVARGSLVKTTSVDPSELEHLDLSAWTSVLRHQQLPLITYPYEWTFGMLKDAALLQLDLCLEGLAEGLMLRDSTPYNVQWIGSQPVFIDIPSFGELDPESPWLGYRQFCQLFLNPLMMQAYLNMPFQPWLRGSLDGIAPEVFRGLFRWTDAWKPGVLPHVFLQSSLETGGSRSSEAVRREMREAGLHTELIKSVLNRMRKLVTGLSWKASTSRWSEYGRSRGYADRDLELKDAFVRRACQRHPARTCWDVGANDGRFSRIAAESFECVLALDSDLLVLERLYQSLKAGNQKIYPLYYNFADPSPGLGWRNQERKSLLQRSHPDLVLCLAVFHHLVIGANIILDDLLAYLREWNCRLVVEFVTRQDPMVQGLLSAKGDEFDDYDLARFEQWIEGRFQVVEREELPSGTRVLFELSPC